MCKHELAQLREAYALMSQGRNDAIDDLNRERQENRWLQTINDHLLTGMEQLFTRCRSMRRDEADAHVDAEADETQERLDERDAAEELEP